MELVKIKTTVGVVLQFNIDVPKQVKPKVDKEFIEDGERFYSIADGRIFKADMYDKAFGAAFIPGPIRPRGTRDALNYMRRN